MICALAPYEQVYLLVNDSETEREVSGRLRQAKAAVENIQLLQIPTVDVWMRDYGPTFVTRASKENPLALNDWIFNGWGGKYQGYLEDDRVAKELASE